MLSLAEESHNMIMSTLKHIHGDDFSFGTEADYKDRGSKIKKSYWKERGELIIQGGCDYSYMPTAESGEVKMKLYALMKLQKATDSTSATALSALIHSTITSTIQSTCCLTNISQRDARTSWNVT